MCQKQFFAVGALIVALLLLQFVNARSIERLEYRRWYTVEDDEQATADRTFQQLSDRVVGSAIHYKIVYGIYVYEWFALRKLRGQLRQCHHCKTLTEHFAVKEILVRMLNRELERSFEYMDSRMFALDMFLEGEEARTRCSKNITAEGYIVCMFKLRLQHTI
jgi:hypothetical protein